MASELCVACLGQGDVFTGVCLSTSGVGEGWLPSMHHRSHDWEGLPPRWDLPPEGSASKGVCIQGVCIQVVCIQVVCIFGVCIQGVLPLGDLPQGGLHQGYASRGD